MQFVHLWMKFSHLLDDLQTGGKQKLRPEEIGRSAAAPYKLVDNWSNELMNRQVGSKSLGRVQAAADDRAVNAPCRLHAICRRIHGGV
jgi:hypothetical protein